LGADGHAHHLDCGDRFTSHTYAKTYPTVQSNYRLTERQNSISKLPVSLLVYSNCTKGFHCDFSLDANNVL
jgi:hypothetical protein